MIITGIATQGFKREWVTKYTMMANQDNRFVSFRDVDNANPEKVRSEDINKPDFDSDVVQFL